MKKQPPKHQKPEKKEIKSYSDLRKLIDELKNDDKANPIIVTSVDAENKPIKVSIPSSNKPITRKLLSDGFDLIKQQENSLQKMSKELSRENDDYDGYYPARINDESAKSVWVDNMVSNCFGGRRDGLKIVWDLPEGKFELNPWTLDLSKT